MQTTDIGPILARLFTELVNGATSPAYVLNTGDIGLLQSLDKLPSADASRSTDDRATIAAHAQHVRFGLSLMNQWRAEGGDPFTNATWDEAWKISAVDAAAWAEIRSGLRRETERWTAALIAPREVTNAELTGMISSVVHLAYHLGAIRQINKALRGPQEGTFSLR